MEKSEHCYVGRCRDCHGATMITTDMLDHKRDTAKMVADAIRAGRYIERMTVEEGRKALKPFCHCGETEAEEAERKGQQKLFAEGVR